MHKLAHIVRSRSCNSHVILTLLLDHIVYKIDIELGNKFKKSKVKLLDQGEALT